MTAFKEFSADDLVRCSRCGLLSFNKTCCGKETKATPQARRYGMSEGDRKYIIDIQDARCGCCRSPLNQSDLGDCVVEHDHATDAIRGITCRRCNVTLGHMGDTLESVRLWAMRALSYFQKGVPRTKAALDLAKAERRWVASRINLEARRQRARESRYYEARKSARLRIGRQLWLEIESVLAETHEEKARLANERACTWFNTCKMVADSEKISAIGTSQALVVSTVGEPNA